ncbi:MAG TPA: sigma 54-interacting transcriptional regulator [Longimicrobiaceae bacterium]
MRPAATPTAPVPPAGALSELAETVRERSVESWGALHAVTLIGRDGALLESQRKLARFADSTAPILLTGETGTGKELFARALYLLGPRRGRPFIRVNCAQFHDGNLMASELFGHKKGSFTGAVADHRGIFEEANGGVVFLDEIGELSAGAQAMLLRALSEGEVVPVGGTVVRYVDVRVIAATSRDLRPMVEAGTFREDLFYRLHYLWIHVPPLRDRGGDWELIAGHCLAGLACHGTCKTLAPEARALLGRYHWPGNVRELNGLIDMGFHLADGREITAGELVPALEGGAYNPPPLHHPNGNGHAHPAANGNGHAHAHEHGAAAAAAYERMMRGGESFWEVVREPFMEREISRADVRALLHRCLGETGGSYKRLLPRIGVAPGDYLKFMDFLRHHRLKPEAYARGTE